MSSRRRTAPVDPVRVAAVPPPPPSPPGLPPLPTPLPTPRTAAGAAGLAALLADPASAVVALDFDGTLAPIVARPEDARPADGATAALARVAGKVGAVVVVTGRPAETVVRLGGFASYDGLGRLVVLGHYGWERWSAETSRVTRPPLPPGVDQARAELSQVLAAAGAPPGTAVEDKEAALGVHVRGTADPAAAMELLRAPLAELAARTSLVLEPGRMVLELRPPGSDKGAALLQYVEERASGTSAVLFAGDDLGDLPAYDAVETLRQRDVPGLTVCSSSVEVTVLADRADLVVDGPPAVVALLEALADVLPG